MEILAIILFYLSCVLLLISVHESGHYLAGWLAGIPAKDMRIRLLRFPQDVVLRSGDKWVAPTDDTFVELVWQYLKTTSRVYLYVSGGVALETLFVIVASVILMLSGWPRIAITVIGLSFIMLFPWLIIDTIMIARGRIFGDFSGLWLLSPVPTALIMLAMIAVRGVLFWWAW